ncbi:propionyl-CoA carboxylase subunit beta [soil metagenome]
MSWEAEIEELRRREALSEQMGGEERVANQKRQGKLTVRERIHRLIDPGSFHEIGKTAGAVEYDETGKLISYRAANMVTGRARIDGRPVAILGDDFTVRGGAADASIGRKMMLAEQTANEWRMPIIRLVDGTGGGGSARTLSTSAKTHVPEVSGWQWPVSNMGTVPVVALALGPCAGLGAARVASCHYAVMVKGLSQIFAAGPPVVKALGENVTKEELGGWEIHARNGTVDEAVESEDEALACARKFLSYLPSSIDELPPRGPVLDDPNRREDWLISAIPRDRRKVYKARPIIEAIVDTGSFFEIGRHWGKAVITGLARLDGWPVAIIAGDPYIAAGAWTAQSSEKLIRLGDLAQTFHLPVVHLVDVPGFAVGVAAEKASTIRYGVRAQAAVYQATVPWATVILRKSFGIAGAAVRNHARAQPRYAWPSGDWGSLPTEGGIEAAYKRDLEASDDPQAMLAELRAQAEIVRSPFRSADAFLIEEIIDPRDTRKLMCEFANEAQRLLKTGPSAFHMRP